MHRTTGSIIRINPQQKYLRPSLRSKAFLKGYTDVPFTYKFADEEYNLKFAAEERIGKLASLFTVLAIMISCLGLFGLAIIHRGATNQRNRNPKSSWVHRCLTFGNFFPGTL
jgi:hypothetical protein